MDTLSCPFLRWFNTGVTPLLNVMSTFRIAMMSSTDWIGKWVDSLLTLIMSLHDILLSLFQIHMQHTDSLLNYIPRGKRKKCIILHEEVLICRTGNCSPQCGNRELSITPRGLWRYGNQVDDWFTWIIFIQRCRYNYSIISYIVGLRSFCDGYMTINKS